jgi:hypothetical protein
VCHFCGNSVLVCSEQTTKTHQKKIKLHIIFAYKSPVHGWVYMYMCVQQNKTAGNDFGGSIGVGF